MLAKTLQLAFHGLDNHDEVWIRSVFNIALSRLKHQWELGTQERAQVLISYPGCLPEIKDHHHHLLVMIQKDDDRQIPGTLVLPQPLRSQAFLQLLNRCGDEIEQGTSGSQANYRDQTTPLEASANHPEQTAPLLVLPPYLHWVNVVHQALAAQQDVAVLVGGEPCYVINNRTRRIAALCGAVSPLRPSYLVHQWVNYSDEQLQQWQTVPYQLNDEMLRLPAERWWSLDSLLWHFGLKCALQKRLMLPPKRMAYRLWRWPDFGELGAATDEPAIAAALSAAYLEPQEVVSLADTELTKVQRFLQAALVCNYLLQRSGVASDQDLDELALNDKKTESKKQELEQEKESSLGILGVIRNAFNLKR
ncbi:MAG: hypothetical protein MI750_05410 [Xanthomonadales bacterium]|nr:hypothetical protein [Xanthomonadales bacterium]